MKLSLNWLKDFLSTTDSVDAIVETLTFGGVEIEGEDIGVGHGGAPDVS